MIVTNSCQQQREAASFTIEVTHNSWLFWKLLPSWHWCSYPEKTLSETKDANIHSHVLIYHRKFLHHSCIALNASAACLVLAPNSLRMNSTHRLGFILRIKNSPRRSRACAKRKTSVWQKNKRFFVIFLSRKFSQRIWYVAYFSAHAHMTWSQKFRKLEISLDTGAENVKYTSRKWKKRFKFLFTKSENMILKATEIKRRWIND